MSALLEKNGTTTAEVTMINASLVNREDGLLPLIPATSAKLANMVSISWVLASLILMPKTA